MNEFILAFRANANSERSFNSLNTLGAETSGLTRLQTETSCCVATANCSVTRVANEGISVGSSEKITATITNHGAAVATLAKELAEQPSGYVGASTADNALRGLTDWIGSRPLYFTTTEDGVQILATNLRWLLSVDGVDQTIDTQSVYNFIHFHIVPGPATIFRAISKVGAASVFMAAAGDATKEQRYWPPEKSVSRRSGEALQAELRDKMRAAVARLHPGDDRIACFLSGGLDSSTIAGLLSERGTTHAFTIGFGQDGYDEMPYAETAAAHFGLEHHKAYITPAAVLELLPKLAGSFGEPFGNLSCIPAYYCANMANDQGFATMFAGDGGDELFAGNERYARHQLIGAYQKLPKFLRRSMEPLLVKLVGNRVSLLHKIGRYVDIAKDDLPVRLREDFEHFQNFAPEEIFSERFLKHVNQSNPLHQLRQMVESSPDDDLLETLLWVDWKITLTDNDLRKVHYACKAAGVTPMFPMLDRELMEFSRSIPSQEKLTRRRLRALFKDAFTGYLPESIINKPKHGFGLPFGEWLRDDKGLAMLCEESFARMEQRGIFERAFIPKLRAAHRDTHAAYFGTMIGTMVMLDLWLESQDSARVLLSL